MARAGHGRAESGAACPSGRGRRNGAHGDETAVAAGEAGAGGLGNGSGRRGEVDCVVPSRLAGRSAVLEPTQEQGFMDHPRKPSSDQVDSIGGPVRYLAGRPPEGSPTCNPSVERNSLHTSTP